VHDPGGQKLLATIESSARRGSDIVKQVLAFGRGVKGDRILVQLRHVVNEVVKISGETIPKSIEIRSDLPGDLWTVSADPTQMLQVLLNLVVNARDAMPGGGTLTLKAANVRLDEQYSRMCPAAKPGPYVSLAVTDTGTGIPPEIRETIFDPFFTTKEIGKGTGLGLSTTLAIVRSHEGFITLDSEVGEGTTFTILIPAADSAPHPAEAHEDADLPTGHGELILVIDDEAAIREITRETLHTYGYEVVSAGDGAEGVAVFAEHRNTIKAVITDIMMPVMDGTAAILALTRICPGTKIIAVSGLTSRKSVTAPSGSNVRAFLTKPYTAATLLRTLAAALR
jgi:CheY-like chemotaxis protein